MAKPVLVIGNKNYSSWSFRPWLVLKQIGIDFEEIRVPLFMPGYKEKILQHSPAGRVPIYKEGNLVVWDSLAICEYLAEKESSLWPASAEARANARAISAEMHSGFSALRNALPMNCRARGRKVQIADAVSQDIRRIQQMWCACRERHGSAGPWLFGSFSVADAMYAPVVSRFLTYGVECDSVCKQYMDSVLSNPHVKQWFADGATETEVIEEEEVGAA